MFKKNVYKKIIASILVFALSAQSLLVPVLAATSSESDENGLQYVGVFFVTHSDSVLSSFAEINPSIDLDESEITRTVDVFGEVTYKIVLPEEDLVFQFQSLREIYLSWRTEPDTLVHLENNVLTFQKDGDLSGSITELKNEDGTISHWHYEDGNVMEKLYNPYNSSIYVNGYEVTATSTTVFYISGNEFSRTAWTFLGKNRFDMHFEQYIRTFIASALGSLMGWIMVGIIGASQIANEAIRHHNYFRLNKKVTFSTRRVYWDGFMGSRTVERHYRDNSRNWLITTRSRESDS